MSDVVAGFCVPHTPYFPLSLPSDPDGLDSRCYARVRAALADVRPDLIVSFTPDHLNTFFYDNLPAFTVTSVEDFGGPNDRTAGIAERRVRSHAGLGKAIYTDVLGEGFDVSLSQRLDVDHALLVPLHFIAPEGTVPVVPIIVNALAPPIPTAARALALGRAVGAAIRRFDEPLRVVLLATGSINHEVAGPRALPGEVWGIPDPPWLDHVLARLQQGDVETLAREATWEKLASVGNVAGELLTIMAMLGALGDARPSFLEPVPTHGHAHGAWLLEAAE
jgi:aromatic ring-opening dioxygenase catalytic subunit (LigB family)